MNIQQITTDELLAELERRKEQATNSDHFLCIGIIDNNGAESLMPVLTAEKFAGLHSSLSLRARFNTQRNPILYAVNLNQALYDVFDKQLKGGQYVEVGEQLKELSTFKRLGF